GRTRPYACLQFDGLVADRPEFIDNGTAKFDLALELEATTGKACFFEYSTDLFKEETIIQMESDFQSLLRGLIAEPDRVLSEVKVVDEISRRFWRRNSTG
ncbi:MAG: condensation domain-containing protein, partial [Acidobacteriota bacterium]|nr:condensation domain-containing protein [Acidobacteriota bacterium]